jgi:subtilisin family serine protease
MRSLIQFVATILLLSWSAENVIAQDYVEGEVIVTFKPGVAFNGAQQALRNHSAGFTKHFAELSRMRGKHFGLVRDQKRTTAQLIAGLSKDPAVETVETNYLRWISAAPPNDPLFNQMWSLQNTGISVNGLTGIFGDDIKFLSAWTLARPSTNEVVAAVIDTGVDYSHPDLAGNMWTNTAEISGNGLDDDGDGYADDVMGYNFAGANSNPSDSGYHGTHVAGTIAAAGNNNVGTIGVDYRAKIMALRASDNGSNFTSSAIIEAVQYATMMKNRGVNVAAINASFGGGGYNSVERAAIQSAGDAGIIYCAAAGNSSLNHDTTASYPASYRLSNMIVVAATGPNDTLASFSDYGATTVDLAAPGVNVLSTLPLNQAPGIASVQRGGTAYSGLNMTYAGTTPGITATLYDCGLGNPGDFPAAVQNNIALISRGTITFAQKVSNAMAAGAKGAIIYNNVTGNFNGTLGSAGNWIPAISIAQADGLILLSQVPTTVTLVNTSDSTQAYQFLNGTSMATPHVVGAVAFAAMNFPNETVAQRIQRILSNVDVIPTLTGKVITGGRLNLLRIVDSDGNGLPDWWELENFGQLTGANTNADFDGDRMSNFAEWIAGTNPTNSASNLRVSGQIGAPPNTFVLQWPSVAGKTYRVEMATNLLRGFNTVLRTNIAATPPFNSETDSVALPASARFYRINVEQ